MGGDGAAETSEAGRFDPAGARSAQNRANGSGESVKVGLLIPALNSGGAERAVSRLSKVLGRDYDVRVVVFDDSFSAFDVDGGVLSLDVPAQTSAAKRIPMLARRIVRMRRLKRREHFQVVFSFLEGPNLVNVLSRVRGCATVVSIRNYEPRSSWFEIFFARVTCRSADRVVAVSQVIAQRLIAERAALPARVHTIYNPYDTAQIRAEMTVPVEPEFVEFTRNAFTFVTVGRNSYQKGFWHLIKAFSVVAASSATAKLVIIGRDVDQDAQVASLIDELGLGLRVMILGYRSNPFQYIARCQAYVLSSLFEGFPNALVEAMACGCPVVAADCKSGPREILSPGSPLDEVSREAERVEFGVLVPPLEMAEDWAAERVSPAEIRFAEGMSVLLDEPEVRRRYAEAARHRADWFGYSRCLDAYSSVITEVVGESHGA